MDVLDKFEGLIEFWMKKMFLAVFLVFSMLVAFSQTDALRLKIHQIIRSKNATVGVAISGIETKDTLTIYGNQFFPLFSVVKFPTALTIFDLIDEKRLSLDSTIHFIKSSLDTNTFSPLRDESTKNEFDLSIRELLSYSVSRSDNIAFEKLVELAGRITVINDYLQSLKFGGITIKSTASDGYNAYLKNQASPLAMNELLIKTYTEKFLSIESRDLLWKMMLETPTGPNRIKGLLPEGTKVFHKTGTSGADENGLSLAFNDVGIVTLPNGKHFAISVFITNSKESDEENTKIIAEISKAAWDYFVSQKN